jgi:hypothetical protein
VFWWNQGNDYGEILAVITDRDLFLFHQPVFFNNIRQANFI